MSNPQQEISDSRHESQSNHASSHHSPQPSPAQSEPMIIEEEQHKDTNKNHAVLDTGATDKSNASAQNNEKSEAQAGADNSQPTNSQVAQPSGEEQKQGNMEEEKNDPFLNAELANIQSEEIRKEIEENSPLISDILPLEMLEFEFAENKPFLNLMKKYPNYRKVRRDGSCFYRAFLFRIFEYLVSSKDKVCLGKFEKTIKDSKKYLMDVGFEEFVIEDFQEGLLERIESVKKNDLSLDGILDTFCNKVKSDSLVLYVRFLISGYLKTNAILYEHFLENGMTIDHFCQTEVEPIGNDADQMQIMALVNYLEIPIKILYLDGNLGREEADELHIPEDADKKSIFITLLYRPGHYDILYV